MNVTNNLVRKSFRVPPLNWPVPPRGYKINSIQKLVKTNHIRGGLNKGLPPVYLRQNWKGGRGVMRNQNVSTIPDGAYLYLIEYDPETNRYYKQFAPIINLLEIGSRHFQLPTHTPGRVLIAAGEMTKVGSTIRFNLESGTYTRNIMSITNKAGINRTIYTNIVKNAFRNATPEFTNQILAPQVPGRLKNLMKLPPNNITFTFGGKATGVLKKNPAYLTASAYNVLKAQHNKRKKAGNSSNNNSPSPRRSVKRPRS